MTLAQAGARPLFQPFNSARLDAFAQWSQRPDEWRCASQSAAQLPYELRPMRPSSISTAAGITSTPYGYVWFPSVGVAWRPYYDGAWGYTRYGWTWHGRDRWAWPTHHYGRWGFNGSFWYLDSGKRLGPGLGQLGLRAWLRELVAARVGRTTGDRFRTRAIGRITRGARGRSCRAITSAPSAGSRARYRRRPSR